MTNGNGVPWTDEGLRGVTGLTGVRGLTGITGISGYVPRQRGLEHTSTLMSMYPKKANGFFINLLIWLGFRDAELF